jgi:hypothetical protein
MISAFPELQKLFLLDSFDQDQLDHCVKLINEIYTEKDKNRMAHSMLKLELLKYQMSGGKQQWISKFKRYNPVKNSKNKDLNRKKFGYLSSNKIPKTQVEKIRTSSSKNWRKLSGKSISELSLILDVRTEFIIRLIKRHVKGERIAHDHKLDQRQLEMISDYIDNRLSILERLKKNKSHSRFVKTKKTNLSVFKGVWGQMRKYGSPGKIIYIRSR